MMEQVKEFTFFESVTRKQFFRWFELYALYQQKDHRTLSFEDKGYVDDIDVYITGCLSRFPIFFMIDSSTGDWEILNDVRKFKTLLDFYENKISCQGFYYKDLKGYQRDWLSNLPITAFCMNPCSQEDREPARKYLKQ